MRPNPKPIVIGAVMACVAAIAPSFAQTPAVAMSESWAKSMCAAWNADATLTTKLVESDWVKNDGGRGYKAMQIYRGDCPKSPRIEMQVALKDNKAICTFGGAAKTPALNGSADYLMLAETARWRAMMFGHLNFEGPKMEAMSNMGPFENFLLLVGKVPSYWASCPGN